MVVTKNEYCFSLCVNFRVPVCVSLSLSILLLRSLDLFSPVLIYSDNGYLINGNDWRFFLFVMFKISRGKTSLPGKRIQFHIYWYRSKYKSKITSRSIDRSKNQIGLTAALMLYALLL